MAKKETRHSEHFDKLSASLVSESENIDAPYELPEGWKWCRLGDVIETSKEKTDTFSSEMKYVGLEHIDSNGKINGWTSAGDVKSLKNIFHVNQILYGKLRPYLNKHDIADFTGVCSTDILVFNAKTDCSNKYINYFFNLPYFIDFAVSNSKGINLPRVSERIILEIPFPLPPTLAEQQRIVNRIETMFAKLDQAQEKAQSVLDSFETRKAAILHKAFTGELTANWRKENGVPDDSWEEKTIGDCFTHTTGKALKKDNQNGKLHKYITTSNLYWGTFDFSEVREMYFNDDELEKCTAKRGDLLICNGGDVGRAAIWDFDYNICLQNHVSKLRKKDNNLEIKFFFYYFMLSKIKGNISGKGIGISSLSAKDLLAMEVSLPSLPEQQEIVRILDTVLEKESRAKEAAQTVLDQIALLKKSILARAFRGEM